MVLTTEILWNGKHNKFITENGGATCSCCDGKRFREANYKDFPLWVIEYNSFWSNPDPKGLL